MADMQESLRRKSRNHYATLANMCEGATNLNIVKEIAPSPRTICWIRIAQEKKKEKNTNVSDSSNSITAGKSKGKDAQRDSSLYHESWISWTLTCRIHERTGC